MVEWEYIEFTKSHKHIKNASTCETIVTESELKTGIRHKNSYTIKDARKVSWKPSRTRKKTLGQDLNPGKNLKEEKVYVSEPLS